MLEMNCRGAAWFVHFLFSEIFFFFFFGQAGRQAAALAYTRQLADVWGNRLSHLFFSDEIRGNPRAAQGRPHILLFFLLYSIILSDRASPLSADSRASFQLAGGKGGPLVCRHAGGNWIIPEIWASAQMESVIKAESDGQILTQTSPAASKCRGWVNKTRFLCFFLTNLSHQRNLWHFCREVWVLLIRMTTKKWFKNDF